MAYAFPEDGIKCHATAVMVVLDIYPQIMREMVINIFSPIAVSRQIQNEPNQSFMKQLAPTEKRMISKLDSTGYNDLDISCLYKVIRYFNLLPPPTEGWGQKPKPEDQCEGDDVERMKRNRNDIIHRPRGGLLESERNDLFQQSIEIAKRMDSRIGSPQNGFESKIKKIQSNIVSQEQYIKALEKCAEYQARLQETAEAPCFNLYYGNDIKITIDAQDVNETNGVRTRACTIYLKDPNFDVNDVIEMLEATKESFRTGTYGISLENAESGSLNLHVSISDGCFMRKEILHIAIQLFMYDIFRTASIECKQGHTYTVVLAKSTDLVLENELTRRGDVDYLKENPSAILKLNVNVKDSAFQNEYVLYREVNRFMSGLYNAVGRQTAPVNGSAREVLMLTANKSDTNCTPSLDVIEDPPQLRMAQEPIVGKEAANYLKISTLLLRIAPKAVRIKFDDVFCPEVLKETLNSNLSKIAYLKNTRCINQMHWNSMFPRKGDPTSQFFDTGLMISLLHNLRGIQITNQLPIKTDKSVGADLSRIHIYRHDIAKSNEETCNNEIFTAHWNDTETAVLRLSDGILKRECRNLKSKSYVVTDQKNTLINIQVCKRLVKNEVADRVENIDTNQDCIMKEKKKEWDEERKWFVETHAFNFILEHLDEKIVTIVGNPGMGKSMLLHQTASFLKDSKGYSVFSCHGPSDIISQFRKNKKQVFIIDDACGQYKLIQSNVDKWRHYEMRIARVLESTTVVLLSSCRTNVFSEKQCKSLLIFSGCLCDLNTGDAAIGKQEKLKIAEKYLSQKTISEIKSHLDSFDMFPLLCRLYRDIETRKSIRFFHDPFYFYKEELDSFYKEDGGIKCCSLFLCVINSGHLNQAILMDESESDFSQTLKTIFPQFGLNPDTSRQKLLDSLETLLNIYIIKRNDEFLVLDTRILDFLCYYFGQRHQQLMIYYAKSEIIRDRTLLKTLHIRPQDFTILVDTFNENDYIERLINDMFSGHINDVLYNNQMIYEDFRFKLVSRLKKLDHEDLTLTHVFSNFVLDKNEVASQLLPLNFACRYGYKELFEFFLSKTRDLNAYEGNNIPLITACRKLDSYMTSLLLENNADVNQTDSIGCSPLLWSCVNGNLDIVQMLLSKEADIENIDVSSKSSPLIWVCVGEFLYMYGLANVTKEFRSSSDVHPIVSFLIENSNEQSLTQEHIIDVFLKVLINGHSRGCIMAQEKYKAKAPGLVSTVQNIVNIINGNDIEVCHDVRFQSNTVNPTSRFIDIMTIFVDRGVDIDNSSIGGLTALAFACIVDMHESQSVRYLLSKGASVNKYDKEGTYPLHIAMRLGKEGLAKLLIDNGANIDLPVDGFFIIDWAISIQNISIVDSLINAGANIDKRYENGTTLLHFAIKSGNEEIIKLLLKGGISVNSEDYSGEMPLMIAVNRGLVNAVTILIKEGAEVDTCNSKGVSPLMLASSKGDVNIVRMMLRNTQQFTPKRTVDCLFSACRNNDLQLVGLLLDGGFDTNITEPNHANTCLLEASRDGNTLIVALLLDKEANVNASNRAGDTPLIVASMNGHTTIVRLLIIKKADMHKSTVNGECSLIVACKNNHIEIVKVLIDNGCNIDSIEDKTMQTCLSVASYHGYENIVAYLIKHGANVNTQNHIGNTPLKLATAKRHYNILKMLIEHNADINIRNKEGSTPVLGASYQGDENMVLFLIENGANVNIQNNKGYTSMMLAASKGHLNIVQLLFKHNAEINIRNEKGFTCLSIASYNAYDEIVTFLIMHGANMNTQNNKGNTPLMLAASRGYYKIVRLLDECTANVNIRNNTGDSALMLASKNGHRSTVEILLTCGATINMKNKDGLSALDLARNGKHYGISDILCEFSQNKLNRYVRSLILIIFQITFLIIWLEYMV